MIFQMSIDELVLRLNAIKNNSDVTSAKLSASIIDSEIFLFNTGAKIKKHAICTCQHEDGNLEYLWRIVFYHKDKKDGIDGLIQLYTII